MDAHVRLRDEDHADAQSPSRAGVSGPVVFEDSPLAEYLSQFAPEERGEAVPAVQETGRAITMEENKDEQEEGSVHGGGADAGEIDVDAESEASSVSRTHLTARAMGGRPAAQDSH